MNPTIAQQIPAQLTTEQIQDNLQTRNSAVGFSVAPMLDWTDKHCRYFHRQISQHAWLYSEMVTTGAIIHGNNLPRFLGHDESDSPVVLQLGGSDPQQLATCAQLGEEWGYNEVNLNVGCPSDRVQNNMIGACLFAHPQLVAEDVAAMKSKVKIPVTVKTRIGIDELEDFDTLHNFVEQIHQAGVDGVILHARKAWLQGLSPKENREIPPLKYDWVHQIKSEFPDLDIAINGGLKTHQDALKHYGEYETLPAVNGTMLGRAIYEQPYLLSEVDQLYYGEAAKTLSREQIVQNMLPYIDQHLTDGGKLIQITRHMLGLFHGLPGGRIWRRHLSENAYQTSADSKVVLDALDKVQNEIQRMQDRELNA